VNKLIELPAKMGVQCNEI